VGLAAGALAVAALRPFISVTGAPAVAHSEDKPEPVAERITPLTQGQYRITIATPKWLEQTTAPAGAQVKVAWPMVQWRCVDQVSGAELWRCAVARAPKRLSPELVRSLGVLVAPPTEATPLALALLNSGTADVILIDPAWPRYGRLLLGPALDLDAHEQLLIIGQDTRPSRAIKNTPGQRSVWLSAGD
jgi:hypothetical protein